LLIDEPTNPLDTETELKVINSLASFSEGKTMLLVSHKKNLLQLVSRIMIINQGKLTYNDSRDLVLKQLGTQI
jgi:ATP-binding cassette subfamily C protein LapB